ncbi:MAG: endonuclease MutS2 [Culicoidibacterales bacterium]
MQKAKQQLDFELIITKIQQKLRFKMSDDYIHSFFTVEKKYDKIVALQAFTRMFYENLTRMGTPDILPLASFTIIKRRLATKSILDSEEILQIQLLYRNIQRIHTFYEKNEKDIQAKETLMLILDKLQCNRGLVNEIANVLNEFGNILDSASPLLLENRIAQKRHEQSIRITLQDIMRQASSKMSENFYTIRNNRYVLPIKAEFGNTFKGILHDQSASGTTFYIEPQALVILNNKLQEKKLEEKKEIERIIWQLCQQIYSIVPEIEQNIWNLARYDVLAAKAEYAFSMQHAPVKILATQEIRLYNAKHPLLDQNTAVGNDIFLGGNYDVLMITGANTGGKSVFLKTTGLLVLMAQAGLFLPVYEHKENAVGVFADVFIDIGDEQSMEQNLSTFSGHMTNIKNILAMASSKTLILLDELGSGTDPLQGSALAIAIIEQLHQIGTYVIATTHYNEVKEFIAKQKYAYNAAMSFDGQTLKPTYEIRYGSYGASYAFEIAKALDIPVAIIENARLHAKTIGNDTQELLAIYEQKLANVEKQTKQIEQKQLALSDDKRQFEHQKEISQRQMERQRNEIIDKAELTVGQKIAAVDTLLENLKEKTVIKHNEAAEIKGELNKIAHRNKGQQLVNKPKIAVKLAVGDIVYVETLGANGTLVKNVRGVWTIKVGMLTTSVPPELLSLVKKQSNQEKKTVKITKKAVNVPSKVDLRGMRVYDAIEALDKYMANAQSIYETISIIHGHGTGSVRQAVQGFLKKQQNVQSYRFGGAGEGGVGATFVTFK